MSTDLDETLPGGWRNRAPTGQEFVLHYEAHRILGIGYSMARWQFEYGRDVDARDRRGEARIGPAEDGYRPNWTRSRPLSADGDVVPWPVITPRSRLEFDVGIARAAWEKAADVRRMREHELVKATSVVRAADDRLFVAERSLAEFDAATATAEAP